MISISSPQDVLAIAKERGFAVKVKPGPPPMPVLCLLPGSSREDATDALLAALKAWRQEIIELLKPAPQEGQS